MQGRARPRVGGAGVRGEDSESPVGESSRVRHPNCSWGPGTPPRVPGPEPAAGAATQGQPRPGGEGEKGAGERVGVTGPVAPTGRGEEESKARRPGWRWRLGLRWRTRWRDPAGVLEPELLGAGEEVGGRVGWPGGDGRRARGRTAVGCPERHGAEWKLRGGDAEGRAGASPDPGGGSGWSALSWARRSPPEGWGDTLGAAV